MIVQIEERKPPRPTAIEWKGGNVWEIAEFARAQDVRYDFYNRTLRFTPMNPFDSEELYLMVGDWLIRFPTGEIKRMGGNEFFATYEIVESEDTKS